MISRRCAVLLLDLVESRLSAMTVVDEDDRRARGLLHEARRAISESLAVPPAARDAAHPLLH